MSWAATVLREPGAMLVLIPSFLENRAARAQKNLFFLYAIPDLATAEGWPPNLGGWHTVAARRRSAYGGQPRLAVSRVLEDGRRQPSPARP